jgi:hypothetical protein
MFRTALRIFVVVMDGVLLRHSCLDRVRGVPPADLDWRFVSAFWRTDRPQATSSPLPSPRRRLPAATVSPRLLLAGDVL